MTPNRAGPKPALLNHGKEETMSRDEFIQTMLALYRAANRGDVAREERTPEEQWMKPELAGEAGCQHLDRMLRAMKNSGMITSDEFRNFYDSI